MDLDNPISEEPVLGKSDRLLLGGYKSYIYQVAQSERALIYFKETAGENRTVR